MPDVFYLQTNEQWSSVQREEKRITTATKKPVKAIHVTIVLNCLWQITNLPVFSVSVIITSWGKNPKSFAKTK